MKLVLTLFLITCLYTFQSLFCKLYADHAQIEKESVNPVYSVVYGLIVGLAALILSRFSYHPTGVTILCGLIGGIVLFVYNLALIQASSLGPYSLVMICNLFGAIIIPTIFSALFFHETLTLLQILAMLLMLVSFLVINCRGLKIPSGGKRYLLWCLILFLVNGLYGLLLKVQQTVLSGGEHDEMIITVFLSGSVISAVYLLARRGKKALGDFAVGKKAGLFMILAGLVAAGAVEFALSVLNLLPAAVVFSVENGGVMVLSILFSALLFHEKPGKLQWIGMAMSLVSIILFSLS